MERDSARIITRLSDLSLPCILLPVVVGAVAQTDLTPWNPEASLHDFIAFPWAVMSWYFSHIGAAIAVGLKASISVGMYAGIVSMDRIIIDPDFTTCGNGRRFHLQQPPTPICRLWLPSDPWLLRCGISLMYLVAHCTYTFFF